jgi:choline-sulfatase
MGQPSYNILILLSDQHSKFHLGCYGDSLVRTPHLDRLAAEGMRFDSCYCAAPLCVPSRMAFMSCRTPSANRVWNNGHVLSSAIPTWAHAVGAAGYETALIGRMHFVGGDQRHGFMRRPLGEYSAGHPGAPSLGGPQFKDISGATSGQVREGMECAGYGRTTYQAFDESVAAATCDYLTEMATADQPFAAVAGFVLPHCPFFAPKDLFEYYYSRVDVPAIEADQPLPVRRFRAERGILDPPLSDERVRVARAAYFGLCEYFDQQVGRVLDTLKRTGLDRNTLVLYCSDHGEMAGEHGCWWKSNYYEGSVGVPLVARLPGMVPAGSVDRGLCNLMDIGVTAAEVAGAAAMPAVDGTSLWDRLQGGGSGAEETFSEFYTSGTSELPSRMVRWGDWKLYHCHGDAAPVLYNMVDDPGELCDLAGETRYAEVQDELMRRLYRDWDPERVLARSAELSRDIKLLTAWGRRTEPAHEDTLPIPNVEAVVRQ